jgi:hypothetical protein
MEICASIFNAQVECNSEEERNEWMSRIFKVLSVSFRELCLCLTSSASVRVLLDKNKSYSIHALALCDPPLLSLSGPSFA